MREGERREEGREGGREEGRRREGREGGGRERGREEEREGEERECAARGSVRSLLVLIGFADNSNISRCQAMHSNNT